MIRNTKLATSPQQKQYQFSLSCKIYTLTALLIYYIYLLAIVFEVRCPHEKQNKFAERFGDVSMAEASLYFSHAVRTIRPAVIEPNPNKSEPQYIKKTETQHFTFPSATWTPDTPTVLASKSFKSQTNLKEFLKDLRTCRNRMVEKYDKKSQNRFGWNLFNNPDSAAHMEAEYYYYDQKYQIGSYQTQIPLCVISSGKNLYSRGVYKELILSLDRQNYTNFHVVLIDDASTDSSTEGIYGFVQKYTPRLRSRITFVRNKNGVGSFQNKDSGIKENCRQDQVVIDIDTDDSLVGHQTFKLINAAYQSQPDVWLVYTSYFSYGNGGLGYSISDKIAVPVGEYRANRRKWSTSHLKTYRRNLYVKIPFSYLTEQHVDAEGKTEIRYQRYASDMTIMIAMLEMAGEQRIIYLPEAIYAYRRSSQLQKYPYCHRMHQFYDELTTRVKPPLQILESLQNSPKPIANYSPPFGLVVRLKRDKLIYDTECQGLEGKKL